MKHSAKSFSKVVEEMVTVEDVQVLEEELGVLKENVATHSGKVVMTELEGKVRPRILEAMKQDLEGWGPDMGDYCDELKNYVATISVVELTLSYEPTPVALRRILERIRTLAQKPLIVSLLTNPAILGGAILVVNGEFRDYSLSGRLVALLKEMYGGLESTEHP